ncbi:hypothetical protein F4809DRAFT_492850 [Biscogniauxia mediterranea]|nr:hypothetical protein F4809DRAFT_492850 [Biscogniauxia mediterranea]
MLIPLGFISFLFLFLFLFGGGMVVGIVKEEGDLCRSVRKPSGRRKALLCKSMLSLLFGARRKGDWAICIGQQSNEGNARAHDSVFNPRYELEIGEWFNKSSGGSDDRDEDR